MHVFSTAHRDCDRGGAAKQGSISFLKKRNKKLLLLWLPLWLTTASVAP
jgi:hypothetical protein